MKEKIIVHGFVLILFLVFLQRTITIIRYSDKSNLGKGIIYDSSSYKRSANSATTYTYLIRDKKGNQYQDNGNSDTKEYGFLIGDNVIFRKLNNGDSRSVRMISRNGEQVRGYYGFVDYISPILVLVIILGYLFVPGFLKRYRN